MPLPRRAAIALGLAAALGACAGGPDRDGGGAVGLTGGATPEMRLLVDRYAAEYDMPASLIHRVIQRESGYNPVARNGPYWGLMQILPQTAATMGHRGPVESLLDAETNLKYAGKYLRGAWLVSDGSADRAIMWYSKGYYYEAKRRGILVQTGLRG
jgi:soluble lytic murein transglycosylase-like protein